MKGGNLFEKKEQILDLYFNKHLKQNKIADVVNVYQQYISKTIKENERYEQKKVLENLLTQRKEKLHKQNIKRIMLEVLKKI